MRLIQGMRRAQGKKGVQARTHLQKSWWAGFLPSCLAFPLLSSSLMELSPSEHRLSSSLPMFSALPGRRWGEWSWRSMGRVGQPRACRTGHVTLLESCMEAKYAPSSLVSYQQHTCNHQDISPNPQAACANPLFQWPRLIKNKKIKTPSGMGGWQGRKTEW